MNQTYARFGAFRIAFLITLVLLVIEYVLGMISNLEVQFPSNLPDGNAWGWIWSHSLIIQLHIYTGTLLLVVALVALIKNIATLARTSCCCWLPLLPSVIWPSGLQLPRYLNLAQISGNLLEWLENLKGEPIYGKDHFLAQPFVPVMFLFLTDMSIEAIYEKEEHFCLSIYDK